MIVNVRGTNGSGKSTVVREFLKRFPYSEIYGKLGPRRPEAYRVQIDAKRALYIIGPYQTATGGVDALGLRVPDLIKMIERYAKLGHVLFEGVVISTTFGELGEWMANRKRDDVLVCFMNTPLEDCLKGLKARGANTGTAHVEEKFWVIKRVRDMFNEQGISTLILTRDDAFSTIRKRLA